MNNLEAISEQQKIPFSTSVLEQKLGVTERERKNEQTTISYGHKHVPTVRRRCAIKVIFNPGFGKNWTFTVRARSHVGNRT